MPPKRVKNPHRERYEPELEPKPIRLRLASISPSVAAFQLDKAVGRKLFGCLESRSKEGVNLRAYGCLGHSASRPLKGDLYLLVTYSTPPVLTHRLLTGLPVGSVVSFELDPKTKHIHKLALAGYRVFDVPAEQMYSTTTLYTRDLEAGVRVMLRCAERKVLVGPYRVIDGEEGLVRLGPLRGDLNIYDEDDFYQIAQRYENGSFACSLADFGQAGGRPILSDVETCDLPETIHRKSGGANSIKDLEQLVAHKRWVVRDAESQLKTSKAQVDGAVAKKDKAKARQNLSQANERLANARKDLAAAMQKYDSALRQTKSSKSQSSKQQVPKQQDPAAPVPPLDSICAAREIAVSLEFLEKAEAKVLNHLVNGKRPERELKAAAAAASAACQALDAPLTLQDSRMDFFSLLTSVILGRARAISQSKVPAQSYDSIPGIKLSTSSRTSKSRRAPTPATDLNEKAEFVSSRLLPSLQSWFSEATSRHAQELHDAVVRKRITAVPSIPWVRAYHAALGKDAFLKLVCVSPLWLDFSDAWDGGLEQVWRLAEQPDSTVLVCLDHIDRAPSLHWLEPLLRCNKGMDILPNGARWPSNLRVFCTIAKDEYAFPIPRTIDKDLWQFHAPNLRLADSPTSKPL